MLRFKSLGSGSAGNATLVESTEGIHTTRLLIDCGLRLRDLEVALIQAGTSAQDIDAIFITHEHGDHLGCAYNLLKRNPIPIWMSQGTWMAVQTPLWDVFEPYVRWARDGESICLNSLQLIPFTVPHDAREPLQLQCHNGDRRLGVVTDLGHVTPHVVEALQSCHAVMIETNHDPALLANSSYPQFLKQRIGGNWGHLCNSDAADLLQRIAHGQLGHVVAAHLSASNNSPELARQCLSRALGCEAQDIQVATQQQGTPWFTV